MSNDSVMGSAAVAAELVKVLQHTRQFVLAWIPEYRGRSDRDGVSQMQRVEAALSQIDAALKAAGQE